MEVLFPGSFDPVTEGHLQLIRRAARLFDRVTVGMFINPDKTYLFTQEERLAMLRAATAAYPNVLVDHACGFVADYCREKGISLLLRGIRGASDLPFEQMAEEYNRKRGVETLFLLAEEDKCALSSSLVRRRIADGEPLAGLVPPEILPMLEKKQQQIALEGKNPPPRS